MQTKINSEQVISLLKKTIEWKKNKSISKSKVILNIFIDFIRLRIIPKKDSAQETYQKFFETPHDLKLAGKLETWIEVGMDGNPDLFDELNKKMQQIENFEKTTNNDNGTLKKQKTETKIYEQNFDNDRDDDDIFADIKVRNEDEYVPELDNPILVPWDFSQVAESALQHAVMFAPVLNATIYLLHIVKKTKEIASTSAKLEKIATQTFNKYGIKPEVLVKEGNIFTSITEIANNNRAKLVVMGTHGVKGIQKLTGSWALKVITGTNTPFVVVQEAPRSKKITDIVFPVDYTKENKQKLKQARLLAKHYDINFTLVVAQDISNPQFIKKTKTNLNYVKGFFKQHNISYKVKAIEGTSSSLEAALKYAADNLPDLIMILTSRNLNFQDLVLGVEEQKIIANPQKVPVMVINPKKVHYASYSAFGNSV